MTKCHKTRNLRFRLVSCICSSNRFAKTRYVRKPFPLPINITSESWRYWRCYGVTSSWRWSVLLLSTRFAFCSTRGLGGCGWGLRGCGRGLGGCGWGLGDCSWWVVPCICEDPRRQHHLSEVGPGTRNAFLTICNQIDKIFSSSFRNSIKILQKYNMFLALTRSACGKFGQLGIF